MKLRYLSVLIFVQILHMNFCIAERNLYSLEQFVQDVITRNPDLAGVRERVKAASIAISRVQTLDDPQFLFRKINNQFGGQKEFVKQNRYKLAQKFPFPGKLQTQGKIAEHQLDFVKSQEITTKLDLILQSKVFYFQLYLNQVAHSINYQNRRLLKRFVDGALALYKTGRGSQADVFKAQVELQVLDDELLILEKEKHAIAAMMNALLNRSPLTDIGGIHVNFHLYRGLSYTEIEVIAMQERPELHGLQAMIKKEKSSASLARLNYFPDFTFEFMLQRLPTKNKTAWGINIGFNIPIWFSKRQRREALEAEARASSHGFRLANTRAVIRSKIKELLAKIDAEQERIILHKTGLIPKTVNTLASHEARYRVGKESFLTVLDTRRQLQQFELSYEHARINQEVLLAKLEREVGISIETILIRVRPIKSLFLTDLHLLL